MLKSIRTKLLYGRFNYHFDFQQNKMTIITGPNGYGKTTIINIIRYVLDDNLYELVKIPFEEIELCTDDNKVLTFSKINGDIFVNDVKLIVPLTIDERNQTQIVFSLSPRDTQFMFDKYHKLNLNQQFLSIPKVTSTESQVYSFDVLLRINFQLLPDKGQKVVNYVTSFYSSVGNTIYCGADRLYRDYILSPNGRINRQMNEVIKRLPAKLNNVINIFKQTYTQVSNELDFSFISTLTYEIKENSVDKKDYTKLDYEKDIKDIEKKLDKFFGYGLLNRENLVTNKLEFNTDYKLVFKVFANNYKAKLSLLENLTKKMDLYTTIVNNKLINKKMLIKSSTDASSILTITDGDYLIPLESLSSGEKEIIIMYFNLIFEHNNKMIALIDEPELSAHVSWQYEMLDDFDQIIAINPNVEQVIVCTHSPQVINNRWNQTIDLYDYAGEDDGQSK